MDVPDHLGAENEEEYAHGRVILSWDFPEYPRYQRGTLWYVVAGIIIGGLLIYALLTGNFLFALIVLMFALFLFYTTMVEPQHIPFKIMERGVKIGDAFLSYRDIDQYWFVYEPPHVKRLYLDTKHFARSRVCIDLVDENPNEIRKALGTFATEDVTKDIEPFVDVITRLLRI